MGRSEPERTCVGCRGRGQKDDLVRLVRTAEGRVEADPAGTAAGRGAYVHRDPGCVELALEHGGVGRSLRTGVGPEEAGSLRRFVEGELRNA